MNDWPVFFALMGSILLLLMGAMGFGARIGKHWYAPVGLIACVFGAALILWGVSVQCDGVAVFYRCD